MCWLKFLSSITAYPVSPLVTRVRKSILGEAEDGNGYFKSTFQVEFTWFQA